MHKTLIIIRIIRYQIKNFIAYSSDYQIRLIKSLDFFKQGKILEDLFKVRFIFQIHNIHRILQTEVRSNEAMIGDY